MFFIIDWKGRFLKMKNKWFVGIGVLLVLGFVLAGCGTAGGSLETTPQPESEPSPATTPQQRSITVTGITYESSPFTLTVEIINPEDWTKVVASGGIGQPTEQDYNFSLVVGEDPWGDNKVPFTDSGNYFVKFNVWLSRTERKSYGWWNEFTDETPSGTIPFNVFEELE
jgi:hypothetical protein